MLNFLYGTQQSKKNKKKIEEESFLRCTVFFSVLKSTSETIPLGKLFTQKFLFQKHCVENNGIIQTQKHALNTKTFLSLKAFQLFLLFPLSFPYFIIQTTYRNRKSTMDKEWSEHLLHTVTSLKYLYFLSVVFFVTKIYYFFSSMSFAPLLNTSALAVGRKI